MPKVLLLTHLDLDGSGCAIVTKYVFGEENVTCLFLGYDRLEETIDKLVDKNELEDYDVLILADLCLTVQSAEKLNAVPILKLAVDHHPSSEPLSEDYGWIRYNKKKCGALLLLKELQTFHITHNKLKSDEYIRTHNSNLEQFCYIVDAYDRWLPDSPLRKKSEDYNTLHSFVGQKNFIYDILNTSSNDYFAPSVAYWAMLDIIKDKRDNYVKNRANAAKKTIDEYGNSYAEVVATQHGSQVGHAILDRFREDIDYAVVVDPDKGLVSFRSENSFDVSEVARRHGGDGHKHASGCQPKIKVVWRE